MKKALLLSACLGALVALSLLVARITEASATTAGNSSPALGGTPTGTPEACVVTYTYATAFGTLEPGGELVSDLDCPGCAVPVTALPFPFTFYGQVYTALNILPAGNLQFLTASTIPNSCPAPYPELGPAIYPHWSSGIDISWGDPCRAAYGRPCGIYTSVTGTAPNRRYNVQWLARWAGSNHEVVNFQVQLHEGDGLIDFVYGSGVMFGYNTTIGLQDGGTQFSSYACNLPGSYQNMTIQWTPHFSSACPTYTPIATATAGPTDTPAPPIFTPTYTRIPTTFVPINTNTSTATPTRTSTSTFTFTPTIGSTDTPQPTVFSPTFTPATRTPTYTRIPTTFVPTHTSTSTRIPTSTNTTAPGSPTNTATYAPPTVTRTRTGIISPTSTLTSTATPSATNTALSTSNSTACAIEFTDVPVGSTFYSFIRCMACQGIINGYISGCETGDPCFRPNNNVTRGQLSKIVSNAAGFSEIAGAKQFEDVPVGSTFYDFVWRLADRDIVSGYICGGLGEPCVGPGNLPYFRPSNYVSRGQISKVVSEAAGYSELVGGQQFQDVAPGSTFYDWIWRLADREVMVGYLCGGVGEPCVLPGNLPYFRAASNTTRGQASKIVANTFFPNCEMR